MKLLTIIILSAFLANAHPITINQFDDVEEELFDELPSDDDDDEEEYYVPPNLPAQHFIPANVPPQYFFPTDDEEE